MKTIKTRKGTTIQRMAHGYRYKLYYGGRQYYFPLGVDAELAKKRADEIKDHLMIHDIQTVRTMFHPKYVSKQRPTIGNILKVHEELSLSMGLKPRTGKEYRQCLLRIVSMGLGVSQKAARRENVSVLTEELAIKAKKRYLHARKYQTKDGFNPFIDPSEGDLKAIKRSFNATLRQAKSVFSKEARSAMQAHVPSWDFRFLRDGFLATVPFSRVKKKWVCPPPEKIQEIVWKIENSAGGELYAICALALYGGLRLKEIANITSYWVRDPSPSGPDDVQIMIADVGNFTAKGRQGYTVMKRDQWESIIARRTCVGNRIVRYNSARVISKKAGAFLRKECGLNVQKPLHELRKLFGAYISNRHGLFVAQKYCRHEDPKTTADYYSDCVLPEATLALWERNLTVSSVSKTPSTSPVTTTSCSIY